MSHTFGPWPKLLFSWLKPSDLNPRCGVVTRSGFIAAICCHPTWMCKYQTLRNRTLLSYSHFLYHPWFLIWWKTWNPGTSWTYPNVLASHTWVCMCVQIHECLLNTIKICDNYDLELICYFSVEITYIYAEVSRWASMGLPFVWRRAIPHHFAPAARCVHGCKGR